ncbi:MAG: amino acid adenylation domain-containing protein [Acidobacteriia bacterium]|nr:amino acid adenylation domain-containing protein [Terriglobia bacterium]
MKATNPESALAHRVRSLAAETPEYAPSANAPASVRVNVQQESPAEWNQTAADYPRQQCVHQMLEAQAQLTPNATAVEFEGRSLSYAELDARSNQLAHLLRKRGVRREVLVGVCLERSLEMVVALLGILKAGGAYVPLDPAYPGERIKYVLEDAHAKLLLTQESLVKSLPPNSAEVICLDPAWRAFIDEDTTAVNAEVLPENLAYVIYTSGSTGKPKGVQLEHRSVVNFLCSMRREPGLGTQDVLVAVTTLSFDIAGLEMYLSLLVGARLVIASREATYDARMLKALLQKSGATVMQATPATWRLLFESGWPGDRKLKVLVGGEALSRELARDLASSCGEVWNMYGPTETTIWSAVYRVAGHDDKLVPIGKPIANTTFYILDGQRRPVAVGEEGELHIGGEGLARGYFERPELTAEKFVPDPFRSQPGARMYRTGDLARYRPDGNVEFLGRLDHQVKIRGFRIELGEIESVLEQHPAVRQAVVVAREDTPGDKRLVAYVVPDTERAVTPGGLRSHARKQLPDYMAPSAFVQLATLPLTPNGKVDRKALPAPKLSDFEIDPNYVAPRDATERRLVELWEEVLGIRPVGVTTSFFDLGGRSILAARLFMKITRAFGKDLPLATLFQAPTVEQLAQELRPQSRAAYSTLVAVQPNGPRPAFFCVHGGAGSTLFLHRLARAMGSDQPFYGLEPEGLDGKRFQRTTVEQMAAHYLSEIRKVQPRGPYFIGGYCFGGIVAFEMAQQLRSSGEHAAVVAMFSAPLRFHRAVRLKPEPQPATAPDSNPANQRGVRLSRSPLRALRWRMRSLARTVRSRLHMMTCRTFLELGLKLPQSLRTMYVVRMINQAEQNYAPRQYPGTLALFRGRGLYEHDPHMGWDGLAANLETYEIGDGGLRSRRDIMNEPLVGLLAGRLTECLDTAHDSQGRPAQLQEPIEI